jgi:peptidoglycan/LPS O-acetylase OafA/YrhL
MGTVKTPGFFGDADQAFASLEHLRGILALYVMIAHSRAILWIGFAEATRRGLRDTYGVFERFMATFNLQTRFGYEAVIVFFVLSGFSIAHALRLAPNPFRFFSRRFLRLYPVKFVAICWALAVFVLAIRLCPELLDTQHPYGLSMSFLSPVVILKNMLYMPEGELVRPLWSLPYEMMFYVVAPLVATRPRIFLVASLAAWLAGVFAGSTFGLTLSQSRLPFFLFQFVFRYSVLFALGVALYAHYASVVSWLQLHRRLAASSAGAVVVTMLSFKLKGNSFHVNIREMMTGLVGIILVLIFVRLRIKSSVLDRLGRQSYSLYVCHMPTIIALSVIMKAAGLTELSEPRPWVWLVAPPICVVVAEVIFRCVEQPVRDYLARTRVHTAVPAHGAAIRPE